MKVALAQINPTVGDFERNVAKIIDFGHKALNKGARLVIFPELAVCGYPPKDLLLKDSFLRASVNGLEHVKSALANIAVLIGYAEPNRGVGRPAYNSCVLLEAGKIKAVQRKTLLPSYDVFDEDRYFEPAKEYARATVDGWPIGLSICEDIWNYRALYPRPRYQIDPIETIAELEPKVLVNISASPFSAGKEHIRHELVRNQALKHKIPIIYVNQVGGNDQLVFDGRSIVVNAGGQLVACAAAFSEDLLLFDLTTESGEQREWPEDKTINTYEALVLGLRDYMDKCGFAKAVIGLSGGIDSAVTCAIACQAVGAKNVLGVAMPSPYSSSTSLTDASQLAKNLAVELITIPIEEPMLAFEKILSSPFKGKQRDVTEENIQARVRGTILMSLSNKFGCLVLTTGNKSELAVGYCTLYGDMAGGLAVISDVPKMMVYDLARYINEKTGYDLIPQSTIDKPPSAELKPNQRDQDVLPPYVILDGIVQAYVEQRRSIEEIIRLGYRSEVVLDVINRIDRNEYKRHQAAPGLKVTEQAFGFGWRMPIAQRFKESAKESHSN